MNNKKTTGKTATSRKPPRDIPPSVSRKIFLDTPPSMRDGLKLSQYIHSRVSQNRPSVISRVPEIIRRHGEVYTNIWRFVLDGLEHNDFEPFFISLNLFPVLLTRKEIYERTIGVWWQVKHLKSDEGTQARDNLKRIGSVLAEIYGAPEYTTQEEREEEKKKSSLQAKRAFDKRKREKEKR